MPELSEDSWDGLSSSLEFNKLVLLPPLLPVSGPRRLEDSVYTLSGQSPGEGRLAGYTLLDLLTLPTLRLAATDRQTPTSSTGSEHLH
jgi:hypothetical protein